MKKGKLLKKRKTIVMALITILYLSVSFQVFGNDDFDVERKIVQNNNTIIEQIIFQNNLEEKITLDVKESFPFNFEYLGDKDIFIEKYGYVQELYLKYNLTIEPKENIIIENQFNYSLIGTYWFKDLEISYKNNIIENASSIVNLECNKNLICEREYNEDYMRCPSDCSTGIADNNCDLKEDGKCDPDCLMGDPDCSEFCGDNICQNNKENILNCPNDCSVKLDLGFLVFYKDKEYWNYFVLIGFLILIFILSRFKLLFFNNLNNISYNNLLILNPFMSNKKITIFLENLKNIKFYHIIIFCSILLFQFYLFMENEFKIVIISIVGFLSFMFLYNFFINKILKQKYIDLSLLLKINFISLVTSFSILIFIKIIFNYFRITNISFFTIAFSLLVLLFVFINFNFIKLLSLGFETSKLKILFSYLVYFLIYLFILFFVSYNYFLYIYV